MALNLLEVFPLRNCQLLVRGVSFNEGEINQLKSIKLGTHCTQ